MKKYLIVNADEFGLTDDGNQAIVDAHQNGIVTSTTLLANGWGFDSAISLAKKNPGLGVGIHLNLTFGIPVSERCDIRSLVDKDGWLLPRPALLRRWMTNRLKTEEAEIELRAQAEKVLAAGLTPTHLDSHQNTMMIPPILNIFVDIAREMNIPVRLPYEPPNFDGFSSIIKNFATTRHAKKRFTSFLCEMRRPLLKDNGVKSIDRIYSLTSCFMRPDLGVADLYEAILSRIGHGVSELLTHPSRSDKSLEDFLQGSSDRAKMREKEHEALTSKQLKRVIRDLNIRLISYRELEKCLHQIEN